MWETSIRRVFQIELKHFWYDTLFGVNYVWYQTRRPGILNQSTQMRRYIVF